MKRSHLLPVLAFVPLLIALYALAAMEYAISPAVIGLIIVGYIILNVVYGVIKKSFHVSILVELSLISLIAYFVLTGF